MSGSLDNRCRRQPSDTTIEFCVWRSVINPSTHLCLIQEPKPKHILVFQHIPLYLKSPDEEDDYFNLQRGVRQNLLDRFKKAGRTPRGHKIHKFHLLCLCTCHSYCREHYVTGLAVLPYIHLYGVPYDSRMT